MKKQKSKILTTIGPTRTFRIKRGLEQGDPYSPLLWNIFYEIILKKLNDMSGYDLKGINVYYMAYADDIVLISENEKNMEDLLNTVYSRLNEYNIEIQPKQSIQIACFQCKTFSIPVNYHEVNDLMVLDKKHLNIFRSLI